MEHYSPGMPPQQGVHVQQQHPQQAAPGPRPEHGMHFPPPHQPTTPMGYNQRGPGMPMAQHMPSTPWGYGGQYAPYAWNPSAMGSPCAIPPQQPGPFQPPPPQPAQQPGKQDFQAPAAPGAYRRFPGAPQGCRAPSVPQPAAAPGTNKAGAWNVVSPSKARKEEATRQYQQALQQKRPQLDDKAIMKVVTPSSATPASQSKGCRQETTAIGKAGVPTASGGQRASSIIPPVQGSRMQNDEYLLKLISGPKPAVPKVGSKPSGLDPSNASASMAPGLQSSSALVSNGSGRSSQASFKGLGASAKLLASGGDPATVGLQQPQLQRPSGAFSPLAKQQPIQRLPQQQQQQQLLPPPKQPPPPKQQQPKQQAQGPVWNRQAQADTPKLSPCKPAPQRPSHQHHHGFGMQMKHPPPQVGPGFAPPLPQQLLPPPPPQQQTPLPNQPPPPLVQAPHHPQQILQPAPVQMQDQQSPHQRHHHHHHHHQAGRAYKHSSQEMRAHRPHKKRKISSGGPQLFGKHYSTQQTKAVLGEQDYQTIRSLIMKQQEQFLHQVWELHRLFRLQRLIMLRTPEELEYDKHALNHSGQGMHTSALQSLLQQQNTNPSGERGSGGEDPAKKTSGSNEPNNNGDMGTGSNEGENAVQDEQAGTGRKKSDDSSCVKNKQKLGSSDEGSGRSSPNSDDMDPVTDKGSGDTGPADVICDDAKDMSSGSDKDDDEGSNGKKGSNKDNSDSNKAGSNKGNSDSDNNELPLMPTDPVMMWPAPPPPQQQSHQQQGPLPSGSLHEAQRQSVGQQRPQGQQAQQQPVPPMGMYPGFPTFPEMRPWGPQQQQQAAGTQGQPALAPQDQRHQAAYMHHMQMMQQYFVAAAAQHQHQQGQAPSAPPPPQQQQLPGGGSGGMMPPPPQFMPPFGMMPPQAGAMYPPYGPYGYPGYGGWGYGPLQQPHQSPSPSSKKVAARQHGSQQRGEMPPPAEPAPREPRTSTMPVSLRSAFSPRKPNKRGGLEDPAPDRRESGPAGPPVTERAEPQAAPAIEEPPQKPEQQQQQHRGTAGASARTTGPPAAKAASAGAERRPPTNRWWKNPSAVFGTEVLQPGSGAGKAGGLQSSGSRSVSVGAAPHSNQLQSLVVAKGPPASEKSGDLKAPAKLTMKRAYADQSALDKSKKKKTKKKKQAKSEHQKSSSPVCSDGSASAPCDL